MQPEPLRDQDLGDPATDVLNELPEKYRPYFLAEYGEAIKHPDSSIRPQKVAELLRHWHLRALMYNQPGYEERLAAAKAGDWGDSVSLEEAIARLPQR